jgi:cation diffusion facilitator CzcD-associated flavoprotein CzcO
MQQKSFIEIPPGGLGACRASPNLAYRTGVDTTMTAVIGSAGSAERKKAEHFDVLIVGAGISGIGSAYHLSTQCKDRNFVVLEALDHFGGTWYIQRYPGIRSDSDLYTFGFRFKPWTGEPIATADKILSYLDETIRENRLDRHIRYGHRIRSACWSSKDGLWTIEATRNDSSEPARFTANFLWMCQGYYRLSEGYTPSWKGMDDYQGRIVHPQTWPEDLNYRDKDVVIIGSGATTATLVPAMVADCKHLTILQRSPTYFNAGTNEDELANQLRTLKVDEHWIHEIVRRKLLQEQEGRIRRAAREPETVKAEMLTAVRTYLGPDVDIEKHFTPRYRPWQQRVAFIPDGDFFKAFSTGNVSIVTDDIDRFVKNGILLKSGECLEADIIVTATGFNLCVLGDARFTIDGVPLNFADTVTYRGMMFTGVPNMVWVFGYFRASWTLRVELIADFVCRLLKHMDDKQSKKVTVQLRPEDRDMALGSWIDPENFNPGYLMRSMHLLPKRGSKPEWQHNQDYWLEKDAFPAINLDDGAFIYE